METETFFEPEVENNTFKSDAISDVDKLKSEFIALGGNPNLKTHQEGEIRARNKALAEVSAEEKRLNEGRGKFWTTAASIAKNGLATVAVLFTLIGVVFGSLFGTGLLVVAEVAAVEKGFNVIDKQFSLLYALATVSFFIVVLFIRQVVAKNQAEDIKPALSLRQFVNWLLYTLGIGRGWKARHVNHPSLLSQIDTAIRWLMWSIIIFGLLGRLAEKIVNLETLNWRDAITQIVIGSNLTDIFAYIGSMTMTVALLFSTHVVIYLFFVIFVDITGGIETNFLANSSSQLSQESLIEQELENYWRVELMKLKAKREQPPTAPPFQPAPTIS